MSTKPRQTCGHDEIEIDEMRNALRAGLIFVLEQRRMLDSWAESDEKTKTELWQNLHREGDKFWDALVKAEVTSWRR